MGGDQSPVADMTKMKGETESNNVKTRFVKRPFCNDNSPVFQYSTIPPFHHSIGPSVDQYSIFSLSVLNQGGALMERKVGGAVIEVNQCDLTQMNTDAIVNAANAQLVLGAGVAGAIKAKAGPKIQEACDTIGGTYVGGAVITTGGNLKAKHVIHAVGPRMGEGNEDNKLKNATLNSLKLADENNLTSIAFPAISTGIFGFPKERCAEIMLGTVIHYLQGDTGLKRVVFCLHGASSFEVFSETLKRL
jgi:O-acetyl-ADP-ribose deacetylase (regulator of RNase III)